MTRARDVATQGGLVLLNKTDFSAATTLTISNLFSSTYNNYRVVMNGTSSLSGYGINYRLISSGTEFSGNHNYSQIERAGSTFYTDAGVGTSGSFGTASPSGFAVTADIFNPFVSGVRTFSLARAMRLDSGVSHADISMGAAVDSTNQFDSIRIFTSTGNLTGTIRIYGIRN